jgi:protein arginine N-methyltransferase 1
VQPGDVVLDLGSGTGLLSLFACEAGARHVYGIEGGDIVHVARDVARDNGVADRVTFIEGLSYDAVLPEPVDVIVTETLWHFGVGEGMIRAIVDARERFLRPSGRVLPERVSLWLAPVESPEAHDAAVGAWRRDVHGIDLTSLRCLAANGVHGVRLSRESALADPAEVAAIDLSTVEDPDVTLSASFTAARDGLVHGVGGWFSARLSPSVTLSNRPPVQPRSNWSNALFPLERPLKVRAGEPLSVAVQSVGNGGMWRWSVACGEDPGRDRRAAHSTLHGAPLSLADLRA